MFRLGTNLHLLAFLNATVLTSGWRLWQRTRVGLGTTLGSLPGTMGIMVRNVICSLDRQKKPLV